MAQEAFFVNYPALRREIISNSESGQTENELGLKTQYGLLESSRGSLEISISVPQTDQFEKCFC